MRGYNLPEVRAWRGAYIQRAKARGTNSKKQPRVLHTVQAYFIRSLSRPSLRVLRSLDSAKAGGCAQKRRAAKGKTGCVCGRAQVQAQAQAVRAGARIRERACPRVRVRVRAKRERVKLAVTKMHCNQPPGGE